METQNRSPQAAVTQAAAYMHLKKKVMGLGEQGYSLLKDGRVSEADAVFHQCLDLSEEFSHTHALIGLSSVEKGAIAQAECSLVEADRLGTNPAWASLLRIKLLMEAGEYDQARHALVNHIYGDQLKRERLDIFTEVADELFPVGAELDLPDFLCLGAQKSGTTWLHVNLQGNTAIFLPRKKESQHFSQDFYRNLELYSTNYVAGRGQVRGEICPSYAVLSDERIAFIARHMPDLKLIYIMRDPVERAFSALRMDTHVVKKYADRVVDESTMLEILDQDKHYVEFSKYTKHIEAWERYYPKDRFLFCFMEDIKQRPDWLLEQVSIHLGVPMTEEWNREQLGQKIFAGKPMSMPDSVHDHLRRSLDEELRNLEERFGSRVAGWL